MGDPGADSALCPIWLGSCTNSPESFDQVSCWMKTCLESHPKCNVERPRRDFMPTRLLDVGSPCNNIGDPAPSHIKVVETSTAKIVAPYATLSHCWGPPEKRFVRLEPAKLQEFLTHGIEWENLCNNRNFAHAVEVTRRLGIRYLWIDSLCIIQGPGGLHDWHTEAPLMHRVYRNARVNIAASHSRDRDGGMFFGRMVNDIVIPRYVPAKQNTFFGDARCWRLFYRDFWNEHLLKSWLYSRGWVFQGESAQYSSAKLP
jgi:hypothetical protein